MNNKSVKTIEKQNSFKFFNFRLNVIDAHKIDNKYYKDSEYSGLFQYILDIEKPKDLEFNMILNTLKQDGKPLRDAQNNLDKML
jgi:hypothetical protein